MLHTHTPYGQDHIHFLTPVTIPLVSACRTYLRFCQKESIIENKNLRVWKKREAPKCYTKEAEVLQAARSDGAEFSVSVQCSVRSGRSCGRVPCVIHPFFLTHREPAKLSQISNYHCKVSVYLFSR